MHAEKRGHVRAAAVGDSVREDLKVLLDREAALINRPDFIEADPVQFPRRFERLQDIETAAFLSAIIAWGNRKAICRDAEKMLALMDQAPYAYVMERGYEDLDPRLNIHRTFFAEHMQYFMRGLREVFKHHGSLDAFAAELRAGDAEAPAWEFVRGLQEVMSAANGGATCSRCLPVNLESTALKRVNMALRWLVRDDGIVDMGVWKSIPKSRLFIPLDVHVGNVSRQLGLLGRKANDRKSVLELTGVLRSMRPDDPAVYDFALFGMGVNSKRPSPEGLPVIGSL